MDLKYRIVAFLEKPKSQKLLDVDIIPITWLVFKEDDPDGCYCKFMKGPFTPERTAHLKKMVTNCESPEKDWPTYAIDIRGRAATYQEAERKVLELQHKLYVYTSDTDASAFTKANEDKKALKLKNYSDADGVKRKLNGVSIDLKKTIGSNKRRRSSTSSRTEEEPNASVSSTTSATDDEKRKMKTKLKAKKKRGRNERKADEKKRLPVEFSNDDKLEELARLPCSNRTAHSSTERSSRNFRIADEMKTSEKAPKSIQPDKNLSSLSVTSGTSVVDRSVVTEKNTEMSKVKRGIDVNNTQNFKGVLTAIIESHNVLSKQIAKGNGLIVELNLRVSNIEQNIARLLRDHEQGGNNEKNVNDMSEGELAEIPKQPIEIPIKSFDDFAKHEEQLKITSYRKKMMFRMLSIVSDKLTLTKNIGNILRTYLSRDIAMQFTSVKPMPNKHVFKSTEIYSCVKDAVIKVFSKSVTTPLSEENILKSLRSVLDNAKDWDGQRFVRINKKKMDNSSNV
ncbi:outer spore wall assembly protein SHE10-like isoform X2 [Venturia canescens]|uniref:outer spore wall assembly protein SHE10-like isoform X2 n=1 Tax=Venturia canescens TaxID=32260 RepID=UPI001C9BD318|nr:outer spore wall assembly protein SHE10-like isoform X2 [Venturia canescens]